MIKKKPLEIGITDLFTLMLQELSMLASQKKKGNETLNLTLKEAIKIMLYISVSW